MAVKDSSKGPGPTPRVYPPELKARAYCPWPRQSTH